MYCLSKVCNVCFSASSNLQCIRIGNEVNEELLRRLKCCMFDFDSEWTSNGRSILICAKCVTSVHSTYDFVQTCRKNSRLLLGYLAQLQHKSKHKDNTEVVTTCVQVTDSAEYILPVDTRNLEPNGHKHKAGVEYTCDDVKIDIEEHFTQGSQMFQERELKIESEKDGDIANDDRPGCGFRFGGDTGLDSTSSTSNVATSATGEQELVKKKRSSGSRSKRFNCTFCSKIFNRKSRLVVHIRMHTGDRPYACTVCNKRFAESYVLQRHERTHTGQKPYPCTVCNKRFTRMNHLQVHERAHRGDRPYACTLCHKRFTQMHHLQKHESVHRGEKPYACTECNKRFADSNTLQRHVLIHKGEKPYECTVCNRRFTQCSALRRHIGVHSGEKRFECPECNRRFRDKSNLQRHERVHRGEKPFACTECNVRFADKRNLQRHVRVFAHPRVETI